jgi:hypothetical protein
MDLVKIKADEEFHWGGGVEQQQAFKEIIEYLARPPCWFHPSRTGHSTFICQ